MLLFKEVKNLPELYGRKVDSGHATSPRIGSLCSRGIGAAEVVRVEV